MTPEGSHVYSIFAAKGIMGYWGIFAARGIMGYWGIFAARGIMGFLDNLLFLFSFLFFNY
jgi:hypothetical protein